MSKNLKVFDGDNASVSWSKKLCIRIGECGRAEGDLFVGGRDPWCDPDVTDVDEVVEVTDRCPSGALSFVRKDGGAEESAASENTVVVAYNGPLYIKGDLAIEGQTDEMPGVKFRAALCRCGKSANKPFCDNSHLGSGFRDHGAVGMAGDAEVEAGGQLVIKGAPNGPLLLTGNFSILAASSRVAWRGTKAALCRCGESKNKPFCDGGHVAAGFTSE